MSEQQIARDLERKLHEDMKRVMLHYCDMATLAGIRPSQQIGTICSVLCGGLTQLSVNAGIPLQAAEHIIIDSLKRAHQRE